MIIYSLGCESKQKRCYLIYGRSLKIRLIFIFKIIYFMYSFIFNVIPIMTLYIIKCNNSFLWKVLRPDDFFNPTNVRIYFSKNIKWISGSTKWSGCWGYANDVKDTPVVFIRKVNSITWISTTGIATTFFYSQTELKQKLSDKL